MIRFVHFHRKWVLFKMAIVALVVMKFIEIRRIQRFTDMFTRFCNWTQTSLKCIHPTGANTISVRSVLILSSYLEWQVSGFFLAGAFYWENLVIFVHFPMTIVISLRLHANIQTFCNKSLTAHTITSILSTVAVQMYHNYNKEVWFNFMFIYDRFGNGKLTPQAIQQSP
jgi:hypothetical protein